MSIFISDNLFSEVIRFDSCAEILTTLGLQLQSSDFFGWVITRNDEIAYINGEAYNLSRYSERAKFIDRLKSHQEYQASLMLHLI